MCDSSLLGVVLIYIKGVIRGAYLAKNNSMSSSTVPIPDMPKVSTSTFATLGDRKAGSVGPK